MYSPSCFGEAMVLAVFAGAFVPLQAEPASGRGDNRALAARPPAFEANLGQAPDGVSFLLRGAGYRLFLRPGEASFALGDARSTAAAPSLRIRFDGARGRGPLRGEDPLLVRTHYFRGKDPRGWIPNVPLYARVEQSELYPGIDVVYRISSGRLEYDFIVRPGADPSAVRLSIDGADRVAIDDDGALVLTVDGLELVHVAPTIYQRSGEGRKRIPGGFDLLAPGEVGFRVGAHDDSEPLVIDPEVLFSSYAGGADRDEILAVARDTAQNLYAAGLTASIDYPTGGSASAPEGDLDCVVSKWNPSGTTLLYSAYIGGSDLDVCTSIAVDASGRAFLVGTTASPDFPTKNALRPSFGGDYDAFVLKLDPLGSSLEFSTYWGGMGPDYGFGLALSPNGAPAISGATGSLDFPIAQAFQAGFGGGLDGFVTRLSPAGDAVVYSTFLGGSRDDEVLDLATDKTGTVVLTGVTLSSDFPLLDPIQPAIGSPFLFDAFVTRLDPTGSLAFSTYLGGSETDIGFDIALDRHGRAFVVGGTMSEDFPTTHALQSTLNGVMDGFVAAIDGSTLVYSTYLGGSSGEFALGVEADPRGRAVVTGFTSSSDFPLARATQATFGGGASDGFLAKLSPDGSTLVFSTYHGGSGQDTADALASDFNGRVFLVGGASSTDFPVSAGAFQPVAGGDEDGFIARIATQTLQEQFQDLGALVPELVGDSGGWRSSTLLQKLYRAYVSFARGNSAAGVSFLVSFIRQVQFLTLTESLSADDGRLLIGMAAGILGQIP